MTLERTGGGVCGEFVAAQRAGRSASGR